MVQVFLQIYIHRVEKARHADVETRGERQFDDLGIAEAVLLERIDADGEGAGPRGGWTTYGPQNVFPSPLIISKNIA